MFRLVTQYVMLHCVVLIIWLFETRFLVALLGWVWICVFFFIMGKFSKKSHHVLSGHAIGLFHFAM